MIYNFATRYNEAQVLIEINDIGQEIVDLLWNDLEYENIITTTVRGRKGQVMDAGFSKHDRQRGVRMSPKVKRVGCAILKEMIEQDKMIIKRLSTLSMNWHLLCRKRGSFEAETGHHDDFDYQSVALCVGFEQDYFKDLTDINIREELLKEKIAKMEEI